MSHLNLSNKNYSHFPNFTTQRYQAITILTLANTQLTSVPSEIGKFRNLQQLNLSNNQLTSIPPEIANLNNLITINLANNRLRSLPSEIGKLRNLRQLNLSNNQLTSIPPEIANLNNLIAINLAYNRLSSLPSEIGNLANLQQLHLRNNELTSIPLRFERLAKLTIIDLTDNKVAFPDEYNIKKPQKLIKDILELQAENSLPTNRVYIFRNTSLDKLASEYGENLVQSLQERDIQCTLIEKKEDVDNEVTIVFIVVPFDIHKHSDSIYAVINECEARQKKYCLLLHSPNHATADMMNLPQMEAVLELRKNLENNYADHIKYYDSSEHLANLIIDGIKQHAPLILVKSLTLSNIGHFQNLTLSLDKQISCFEGENGTGKTTILRALAVGLIGADHNKIEPDKLKKMLSIKRLDADGNIELDNGKIELEYLLDGKSFTNVVEINPIDEGRDIEILNKGDFKVLSGNYNLLSLIMGFPQTRGEMDIKRNGAFSPKKYSSGHVDDLIPLINNTDELRLESFSAWIANLDNSANQKEKTHPEKEPEERMVIKKVFEIISKVTDHNIAFKTVRQSNPVDVWVATKDAQNGISLSLVSQGFKVIMGWVGYFVQRLAQAYHFSDDFLKENAIILVDEIDSYLHPKWQAKLLQVLLKFFPKTQFIVSTHSPLILASLHSENIYMLEFTNENEISCNKPPINPYGADANRILTRLMDQRERAIEEIDHLLKKYADLTDSGNLEEAKKIGEEIKDKIDPDDPDLLKTEVIIQAKEFLN